MSGLPSRLLEPLHALRPRGNAWWVIGGAFVAGALAFLMIWLGQRGDEASAPRDAMSAPSPAVGGAPAPLPAPLPASETGASGIEYPAAPPAPPPPAAPSPAAATASGAPMDLGAPSTAPAPASVARSSTVPRPVSTPAPNYPRASLRRGESGEALLRIHVGPNGRTSGVDVVRSSGFSRLDQAAITAVRRWRFEPAMQDGKPVAGELQVPVHFTPADR